MEHWSNGEMDGLSIIWLLTPDCCRPFIWVRFAFSLMALFCNPLKIRGLMFCIWVRFVETASHALTSAATGAAKDVTADACHMRRGESPAYPCIPRIIWVRFAFSLTVHFATRSKYAA